MPPPGFARRPHSSRNRRCRVPSRPRPVRPIIHDADTTASRPHLIGGRPLTALLLVLAIACQGQPDPSAGLWQETRLAPGDGPPATLTLPRRSGTPVPGILFINALHHDRDGNPRRGRHHSIRALAQALAAAGFAVLRYDAPGTGVDETAGMDQDRPRRALQGAWRVLRSHPSVASNHCFVASHADGLLLAPLIAPEARGLILLAPPGGPLAPLLLEQAVRTLEGRQVGTTHLAESHRFLEAGFQALAAGTAAPVPDPQVAQGARRLVEHLFQPENREFARFWLHHDPLPDLARLTVPLLIISGGADLEYPAETIDRRMARILPRAERHILPAMNHLLQHAPLKPRRPAVRDIVAGYEDPACGLDPALPARIAAWAGKHAAP